VLWPFHQMHLDAQRLHAERQRKALKDIQLAYRSETWAQALRRLTAISASIGYTIFSWAVRLVAYLLGWKSDVTGEGLSAGTGRQVRVENVVKE
jgi:hypothetical protein